MPLTWMHRCLCGAGRRRLLFFALGLSTAAGLCQQSTANVTLAVDASSISRKILYVHETLPVSGSSAHTVDLVYPKWIPGNHAPTGPIVDLVKLNFTIDGKALAWTRDPLDMYRFHVPVPGGASTLTADFSLVGAYEGGNDFAIGNTSTLVQGDVNWDQVVLYPAGTPSDDVRIAASIRLPEHWSYATALPHPQQQGISLSFDPVSLTTLIDSPLMCGSIMREFDITPRGVAQKHFLDLFAETPEGLKLSEERVAAFRNLVAETGALFHSRHYGSYHFLVEAHGDASDGLEHHQSSDEQVPELGMVSPAFAAEAGNLLAHEMTHSWNGKFRRPAGLATSDYQQPMVGDLLWVYEGLTSYWAEVLATRAGLETEAQAKDRLALAQAELDVRTGRSWRDLSDVSRSAQLLYTASQQWTALRRSTDFYREGPLLWLQVDSEMRQRSQGKRTLDMFAAHFFGPPDGAVTVKPYTYADLVTALNQEFAFDWNALLQADVTATRPKPVSPGLAAAGWTVMYTDEPNEAAVDAESLSQQADLSTSIGLIVDADGTVVDLVTDSAAARAGLAPAMKIVGVNNRVYSGDLLRRAIADAEKLQPSIEVLTLTDGYYKEFTLDYHQGLRYPHLSRIAGKADLLTSIFEPQRAP